MNDHPHEKHRGMAIAVAKYVGFWLGFLDLIFYLNAVYW